MKVTSFSSLLPMMVNFQDDNGENKSVRVEIDYLNQKVYIGENNGIDCEALEKEIVSSLKLPSYESPIVPPEILQKISEVKSGKYGTEIPNYGGVQ